MLLELIELLLKLLLLMRVRWVSLGFDPHLCLMELWMHLGTDEVAFLNFLLVAFHSHPSCHLVEV